MHAWKLVVGSFTLASVMVSGPAHSDDATHACVTAAYEGQRLRDDGKLVEARAKLIQCAIETCPTVVVTDCAAWLADVTARVPSVVFAARNAAGNDLLRVRVSVDGKPSAERLDGKSVLIDAGPHSVRFEADGMRPVEQSIVVREGEKSRVVTATLQPLEPATPAKRVEPPPLWPAVVTGGVGLAALGVFAYFGATGQRDKNRLDDTCASAQSCAQSDVNAARTKLIVADVFLGLGVVASGVAVYLLVRALNGAPRATAQSTLLAF